METSDSLYFYGHNNDYGYLSNFYPCEFKIKGSKCGLEPKHDQYSQYITFNCNEQYFMFMKCNLFSPHNYLLQRKILDETLPSKIKALGRQVPFFDVDIWDKHKYKIMIKGLKQKFSQNDYLMDALLSTSDLILYEASPRDKIWGIGYGYEKAQYVSKESYGQNLLGRALMHVREEFNK